MVLAKAGVNTLANRTVSNARLRQYFHVVCKLFISNCDLKLLVYPVIGKIVMALFLSFLFACKTNHNIVGAYHSAFAVHGFFGTKVTLKQDSTFEFRMRGDLIFDTSYGTYSEMNGYAILFHKPFEIDTAGQSTEEQSAILLSYALSTNRHLDKPSKYLVAKNKLFVCNDNGDVIRKQFGYSKRRQYIIFGKHWYMRKYYLKKVA